MKELDVLFEAFFSRQAKSLKLGGWPQLEQLLDQEDTVLLGWISGRNLPTDPEMLKLINAIKNVT